jgi:fructokinase
MFSRIGLDIGGTKLAGAIFSQDGEERAREVVSLPESYSGLIMMCRDMIAKLEAGSEHKASVGIGIAGIVDPVAGTTETGNIPYMKDRPFRQDMEQALGRPVKLANDAVCAALAEALEGAGMGYHSVFGLILGTGVGGAHIVGGKVMENTAGFSGEIGHRPLPYRAAADGPLPTVACICGLTGCIEKFTCGPALSRLYQSITGENVGAHIIAERANAGDAVARQTLDRFYTTVAKAMAVVLDDFNPDIIVISGGLINLPGLFDEVPKRWHLYTDRKPKDVTFVPAKFGAMSGLRGAARIGS